MNPINAHEKISALGKLIGQKIPECPLLTLPSNWESEQWSDDYKAHALSTITDTETGKLVLPFPLFRYCLPSGKRLWVRSCWVGPKEWVDAESKQVYRVVS